MLLDLSHTSHTTARTGVQRVALGLYRAFGAAAQPLTFDPYAREWRDLKTWERANLENPRRLGIKRRAHWPWSAQWSGRARRAARWIAPAASAQTGGTEAASSWAAARGLIEPEIFSPDAAATLPELFARVSGPKVALFHDAIALRMPELSPPRTVGRFPAYLRELAQFDGIAAISESSRVELLEYWEWAGLRDTPPVAAILLGIEGAEIEARAAFERIQARTTAEAKARPEVALQPVILSVGSIEGRKNHLGLVQACEILWARGLKFELRMIGLPQRQTGSPALALIQQLQAAGRPLRYEGAAGDTARETAYAAAAFTVYPSFAEGFGLPVAESLVRGKPCVCLGSGALGEIAAGGGCLTVPYPSPEALAEACARLLQDPAELAALTAAARRREFPSPADHARRLAEWMGTL